MKRKNKILIILVVLILSASVLTVLLQRRVPGPQKITYNVFWKAVQEGKVKKVYLTDEERIKGVFKNGKSFLTDNPRRENLKEILLTKNIAVDERAGRIQGSQIIGVVLMMSLFGVLVFTVQQNASKQMQGKPGKSPINSIQPEKSTVHFSSVAGNEEAKESIQDLVDFIQNPEKYTKYGARLPRGVIFYGSPGTGKTLMAKAVAGEAGVPFFAVSGSDFVQVYVGVGASRIRELFKKARGYGKGVIFIDEIDALGKKRDSADGSGNEERDQTLNALLSEMSGFHDNEGIVVIAATNRLDTLDEALLRPGRFDRHIEIQLPDIRSRLKILKLHAGNKPMDQSVDLEKVAQQTVYFSGAKLENLLNEAAILAAKRGGGCIAEEDMNKAFYTVVAGAEKKDRSAIAERDRKVTAYHEAGHALITRLMVPENRVSRITIIPSTKGAGGFSMNIPPDRMYYRKKDMENSIRIGLAGRAAEELIFGEKNITTGASNDLEKATETILNMVRRFGMNPKSGLLNYDVLYRNGMQQVQEEILQECKNTMDQFYREVRTLLQENRKILAAIAENLLARETLEERDLDAILETYGKAG